MSERVLGVIIAVAIGIGICKLIWAGLDWVQVFWMRRRVIRRRLSGRSALGAPRGGMYSTLRFQGDHGKRRIFGPGPGAACGDDAVEPEAC